MNNLPIYSLVACWVVLVPALVVLVRIVSVYCRPCPECGTTDGGHYGGCTRPEFLAGLETNNKQERNK